MIHIDGSRGEGGGQVLRSALTLSLLSGRSIRISNIRANRPNPGLAPQHLTGLLAAAKIGRASVQGDRLKSEEIIFEPASSIETGDFTFDVSRQSRGGSAGAVSLVLQTVILPLLLGKSSSRLILRGGTHVLGSPSFDYLEGVYLHCLRTLGIEVTCKLSKYGFYPVGGGEIVVDIMPLDRTGAGIAQLSSMISKTRGTLISVSGQALAANLPAHIAQRMANRARNLLDKEGIPSEIHPRRVSGRGPGAGLFLVAVYDHAVAGFSSLGKKGKPSEQVAAEAVDLLLDHHHSGKPIDPHLADQLMLVLLLSKGASHYKTSRITQHLETNAELINRFFPEAIQVQPDDGGAGTVIVNPVNPPCAV